jgi:hypothetical protein
VAAWLNQRGGPRPQQVAFDGRHTLLSTVELGARREGEEAVLMGRSRFQVRLRRGVGGGYGEEEEAEKG